MMTIYPSAVIYKTALPTSTPTVRVRKLCRHCLDYVKALPQVEQVDVGPAADGECERLNAALCHTENPAREAAPAAAQSTRERLPLDYLRARKPVRRYVIRGGKYGDKEEGQKEEALSDLRDGAHEEKRGRRTQPVDL